MRAKHILEINTQSRENIERARDFNAENDYKYILVDDNNLIDYNNLAYLLRIGYVMQVYADTLTLVHKNYDKTQEEVVLKNEKRAK